MKGIGVHHFQGISTHTAVCVSGDCAITHAVSVDGVEVEFGHTTGSLNLCLSEVAAVELVRVLTVAVEDFRAMAIRPAVPVRPHTNDVRPPSGQSG